MPYILHNAEILKSYDLEKSLNELKRRITNKNYLENKLQEMFIKNKSRLTFQLIPDDQHDKKKLTKFNDKIQINIALNYGSKEEIIKSIKKSRSGSSKKQI